MPTLAPICATSGLITSVPLMIKSDIYLPEQAVSAVADPIAKQHREKSATRRKDPKPRGVEDNIDDISLKLTLSEKK